MHVSECDGTLAQYVRGLHKGVCTELAGGSPGDRSMDVSMEEEEIPGRAKTLLEGLECVDVDRVRTAIKHSTQAVVGLHSESCILDSALSVAVDCLSSQGLT